MPEPARLYCERVAAALLEANESVIAKLVREFQDEAAQAVVALLDDLKGGERTMRRVAAQIGTRHAMQELRIISVILRNQDALTKIRSRLPAHIRNLGDEQIEDFITLLQSNIRGNPDVLPFALILIANRLAAPWQLIRLAVKAAESDIAARVAQAPLAPAVTLVLADLRAGVADLRTRGARGAYHRGRIAAQGIARNSARVAFRDGSLRRFFMGP